MNWDQIEHRWAAMTSRVRVDWTIARPESLPKLARRAGRAEDTATALADRRVGVDETSQPKTPNE